MREIGIDLAGRYSQPLTSDRDRRDPVRDTTCRLADRRPRRRAAGRGAAHPRRDPRAGRAPARGARPGREV